jgi:hypothetical protein
MAKRTRGSSSSRPGQRRPLHRSTRPAQASTPAPAPAVAPRPATLTPEEVARAAQLEAQLVAEERQVEQAQQRTRGRQREADRDPVVRSSVPLAVREAEEYAYVARDVRRIGTIALGLLAIMIALWVAVHATGLGTI